MLVKTILNAIEKFKAFVYGKAYWEDIAGEQSLVILNWFRANGELSSGPVEGLNNKAKLAMRKAYGFKSVECLKIALYHHQLGGLIEPPLAHRFC